ncbi:MAG: DUF4445 domain-containing protein [Candidatus Omnitrophica bacterium]|nr:DUF4445 domain-containing protein [Candidatus Omnitrophota bacterium]
MKKFKVTFYPDNLTIEVNKDTTILSAAITAGIYINSVCGGDGVCGRCKVVLRKGKVICSSSAALTKDDKEKNIYLACLSTIHSDLEVEIPVSSRLNLERMVSPELKGLYSKSEDIELVKPKDQQEFSYAPLAKKIYIQLRRPSTNDNLSDLERLYQGIQLSPEVKQSTLVAGIENIQTSLSNIKQLGELLRDSEWKITVSIGERNNNSEIIAIEPQNTTKRIYGFAFDIGTTTISGQLIDLDLNKVLGTRASYNKQASFGSDVITRIIYAQEKDGLEKLHMAVIETVDEIIQDLVQEHKIDLNDLLYVVTSGNTTMIHLLLNIDPANIRREPYTPTVNFAPTIRAVEAGININPRGLIFCVPGIASYVGGDITAGVLSSGLYRQEDLGLFIDIGTNGEVVLGDREFLVSCAASAGPAFEGSGVACGMRASRGAIQKLKIGRGTKVSYSTIAGDRPRGICGSGYIDLLAEMLRCGVMDKDGKIKNTRNSLIRDGQMGKEFVIVPAAESASGEDILINEADIENLKRAKAAIYAACSILVRQMNFEFSQLKKIFIAGGFGTYLDIENAIQIGLLPDLKRPKFRFIGNSAIAGARQILISLEAKKEAEEIARKMTCMELSTEPQYMDEYMAALFFPHTDLTKFPSLVL